MAKAVGAWVAAPASEEPELREGLRRFTDWYATTEGGARR